MATIRLDDITQWAADLDQQFEESEGEITPELEASLAAFEIAEGAKLDGYALYIQAQESESVAADAKRAHYQKLADECSSHRKAMENKVKWLKQRVRNHMDAVGKKEIRGDIFRFKVSPNGGNAPVEILVPLEDLPREYVKVEITPNKEALRAGIQRGEVPETTARLGERGTRLRIL